MTTPVSRCLIMLFSLHHSLILMKMASFLSDLLYKQTSLSFPPFPLSPNCCCMPWTGRPVGQISCLFSFISDWSPCSDEFSACFTGIEIFQLDCALLSLGKFIYDFKGNDYSDQNCNFEQMWLYVLNQALGRASFRILLVCLADSSFLPFSRQMGQGVALLSNQSLQLSMSSVQIPHRWGCEATVFFAIGSPPWSDCARSRKK